MSKTQVTSLLMTVAATVAAGLILDRLREQPTQTTVEANKSGWGWW